MKFKRRMEEEPGFLGELAGQFSSHHPPKPRPKPEPAFRPTPENCQRFRQWLTRRWAGEPDALPTQRAAKLLGRTPQTLHRWVKLGKLPAAQVGRFQYCPKGELLRFFCHPGSASKLPGAAAPVFVPAGVNGKGMGRARGRGF